MFVLNSDITIGGFRFSGVNAVEVKRSMHSYTDTAIIKIPSQARIYRKGVGDVALQTVAELLKEGDAVLIKLGYNGDLREEFRGFLVTRGLGMPLVLECEGYSYQMRLKVDLTGHLAKTNVRELLEMACGVRDINRKKLAKPLTDITVICQDEIPIVDLTLTHVNGIQVIDEIKKLTLGTLSIFFLSPTVLWCGFAYTSYVGNVDPFGNGTVSYRLGFNCLKDNGLKVRVVKEPVQVILKGTYATGQVITTKSRAHSAVKKDKCILNNIPLEAMLKKIANEKQYQANYNGYMGHLTGFLQPYCLPGYKAVIKDSRYPERDGSYMVESVTVTFGVSGARRNVEIGPLIGFNPGK